MQTLCPGSGLWTAPNLSKIWKITMTSQFSNMTSTSNLFDVVLFLLSSLVTGSSFMSISWLVLELWRTDWPEIRKSEVPPSKFCPILEDGGKLWKPNLTRMFLIECYWMLQHFSVTALTVFELLSENQLGGVKLPPPPRPLLNPV